MAGKTYIGDSYGLLYRFTKARLHAMLSEVALGKVVDLKNYGTCIGQIDYDFTDLDGEQARRILEELK